MLYVFDSSRQYDPSPGLEKIAAPVLAINSADDVVNPPELGLMEQLMPRVRNGRYVLIPTSEETRGHGTHSLPAVWGLPPGGLPKSAGAVNLVRLPCSAFEGRIGAVAEVTTLREERPKTVSTDSSGEFTKISAWHLFPPGK